MPGLSTIITERFRESTVVIVGDLVADQFLNGTISRVSREAPVFILRHDETVTLPGAAANAAANVASLGGKAILLGFVGDDEAGEHLAAALERLGVDRSGVVVRENVRTTTKVRVLAGQHYAARQQVIRIDYESAEALSGSAEDELIERFAAVAARADAFIVSDYNYGAVFERLYQQAVSASKKLNKPLIVDSRYRLSELKDATSATPNREEVEQILGPEPSDQRCFELRDRLGLESLLITNGNKGMKLYAGASAPHCLDAVGSKVPVDVTGAGDTVIAAYALGLASGLGSIDAATLANHAGGVVVMKKGTATVSADELLSSIGSAAATTEA